MSENFSTSPTCRERSLVSFRVKIRRDGWWSWKRTPSLLFLSMNYFFVLVQLDGERMEVLSLWVFKMLSFSWIYSFHIVFSSEYEYECKNIKLIEKFVWRCKHVRFKGIIDILAIRPSILRQPVKTEPFEKGVLDENLRNWSVRRPKLGSVGCRIPNAIVLGFCVRQSLFLDCFSRSLLIPHCLACQTRWKGIRSSLSTKLMVSMEVSKLVCWEIRYEWQEWYGVIYMRLYLRRPQNVTTRVSLTLFIACFCRIWWIRYYFVERILRTLRIFHRVKRNPGNFGRVFSICMWIFASVQSPMGRSSSVLTISFAKEWICVSSFILRLAALANALRTQLGHASLRCLEYLLSFFFSFCRYANCSSRAQPSSNIMVIYDNTGHYKPVNLVSWYVKIFHWSCHCHWWLGFIVVCSSLF